MTRDQAEHNVVRPIVRSFIHRFVEEAARHVRAGGHAVVWSRPRRALLVVPRPKPEDPMDLGRWSFFDLGKARWGVAKTGPLDGFATLRVPRDCLDIVRRRAERDSVFPGSVRPMRLDCLSCASCCKDNEVILEKRDVVRFERAGKGLLAKTPWARRRDGKIVLVLTRDKRCRHLARDNKCRVYEHRPDACSQFPKGSECCLFAREEELGIVDGA